MIAKPRGSFAELSSHAESAEEAFRAAKKAAEEGAINLGCQYVSLPCVHANGAAAIAYGYTSHQARDKRYSTRGTANAANIQQS